MESFVAFQEVWREAVRVECHGHAIWQSDFVSQLNSDETEPQLRFELAAVWAIAMIPGSFAFPAYVAALASRATTESVRHGLFENAWDESGGHAHQARSHYWLAVRLGHLLGAREGVGPAIESKLMASKAYIDGHHELCKKQDFLMGLGAIALIEEFTTPEFGLILRALTDTWLVATGSSASEFVVNGGAEYFTANISDDERHREEMPRLIWSEILARTPGGLSATSSREKVMESIVKGMRLSIDLRHNFFDGIASFVASGKAHVDLIP